MTIKIIDTINNGFRNDEVSLFVQSFITSVAKIDLKITADIYYDLVEIEHLKVLMMLVFKRKNNKKHWEAKIYQEKNSLTIIAVDD